MVSGVKREGKFVVRNVIKETRRRGTWPVFRLLAYVPKQEGVMDKDRFSRSEGELVTTKEDHNYNIQTERGEEGQVKVERQDSYLWPTKLGKWNDAAELPNEEAARDFIEEDSEERASEGDEDDEGEDGDSDDDSDNSDED
jgi:hypothetical protein